jgi:hypothetical protein
VKEVLWRPIQIAATGKESTTELDTKEPSIVYEILNRHIASNFGVSVPWPCEDERKEGYEELARFERVR